MMIVRTETFHTHYKVYTVNLRSIFINCPPPQVSWCTGPD